jgi:hypothetical protein
MAPHQTPGSSKFPFSPETGKSQILFHFTGNRGKRKGFSVLSLPEYKQGYVPKETLAEKGF